MEKKACDECGATDCTDEDHIYDFEKNRGSGDEKDSDEDQPKTMEEIREMIRIVFKHYTSFGDRTNMSYIQGNKVQKMMKECGVIGTVVTKKDIDILFTKINKSKPNMYFEEFIKLLYEVATLKYSAEDNMDAFRKLLDEHLFKRLEEIGGISKKKPKDVDYDDIIEELFINIINLWYDIYHSYFTFRIDKIDKATLKELQRCEKHLYEFLRDFEICPQLLSKSKVYHLWTHIIETSKSGKKAVYSYAASQLSKSYDIKEENKLFTFSYFLDFMVLMANTVYMKKVKGDWVKTVKNAESLVMLLEKMEISRGFSNFEEKMHRTHSAASSLLPPDSIREKIAKQKPKVVLEEDKDDANIDKILNSKATLLKPSAAKPRKSSDPTGGSGKKTEKSKRKSSDCSTGKTKEKVVAEVKVESDDWGYNEDVKALIPEIKKVFQYYCSFGEPGNITKLKSSMFQKMLKDAKIIK